MARPRGKNRAHPPTPCVLQPRSLAVVSCMGHHRPRRGGMGMARGKIEARDVQKRAECEERRSKRTHTQRKRVTHKRGNQTRQKTGKKRKRRGRGMAASAASRTGTHRCVPVFQRDRKVTCSRTHSRQREAEMQHQQQHNMKLITRAQRKQ